jgi:hypothetical protein
VERLRSIEENPASPFDIRNTLADAVGAGAGMLGINGVASSVAAFSRRQGVRTADAAAGGVALGNAAPSAAAGGADRAAAFGAAGKLQRNSAAGSMNGEVVSPFAAPAEGIPTSHLDNL